MSQCAASTTPTSGPPSPARSPAATISPATSRCAARCPPAFARRACSRSSSPRRPPTSSAAFRSKSGTFPATSAVAHHARRAAARRREVAQLLARHRAAPGRLRSHRRCLPDRHPRSHRAVGKPEHSAGGGADLAVRRDRGAVLHQRRRDQDPGIDVVGRYLWRTESAASSSSSPPATGTTPSVEKVPSTNVIDNICNGQPAPCTPPVLFARINTLSFEEGTPASKVNLCRRLEHAGRRARNSA